MIEARRGFIDLCITLPIRFARMLPLRTLAKILKELILLLYPLYGYMRGVRVAWKMSETACKWGYKEALKRREDKNCSVHWV